MSPNDLKHELRKRLLEHFSPDHIFVFLFGSRADGSAKYNSDWDIGVMADGKIAGSTLERARDSLDEIRTLQSFDLVDFATVSEEFRKIAMRKLIPLIGSRSNEE
jgi:predicted nucleotidyltransferase